MENWLVQGVVAGLVTAVAISLARWAYGLAGFWNERLGLTLNRAELKKVQHLASDQRILVEFLLTQVLWCICYLAVAAMVAPLAYTTGGQHWLGVVVSALGLLIYCCVIYPLGMVVRVRKGDAYISRQKLRIERGIKVVEERKVKG